MYLVVSKWEIKPGMNQRFEENGKKMREFMRSQPGVEFVNGLRCEDGHSVLALIGYTDEAAYQRITKDPNGPFERAAKENRLDEAGTWVWSERGEAVDREPAMA